MNNFKSENEWRYVPTKKQIAGKPISITKSRYLAEFDHYNNELRNYALKFIDADIEYIFVSTEQQRQTIAKLVSIDIDRIKISKWAIHRY